MTDPGAAGCVGSVHSTDLRVVALVCVAGLSHVTWETAPASDVSTEALSRGHSRTNVSFKINF